MGRDLPGWLKELLVGTWVQIGELWCFVGDMSEDAAAAILRHHNEHNRRISATTARFLCSLIEKGLFIVNGEPIIFDWDGNCVQGQHRVTGILYARKPVRVFVVYGVDPEAFATYDQQSQRTLGQVLEIDNEVSPHVLSSSLNGLLSFFCYGVPKAGAGIKRLGLSVAECADMADRFPELRDSVAYAERFRGNAKLFQGPGTIALLHWVFSQANREVGERLFDELLSQDAGAVLSNLPRLLHSKLVPNVSELKLHTGLTEAYTIRAFNAMCRGEELKTLRPIKVAPSPWDKDWQVEGWEYVPYNGNANKLLPILGRLCRDSILCDRED